MPGFSCKYVAVFCDAKFLNDISLCSGCYLPPYHRLVISIFDYHKSFLAQQCTYKYYIYIKKARRIIPSNLFENSLISLLFIFVNRFNQISIDFLRVSRCMFFKMCKQPHTSNCLYSIISFSRLFQTAEQKCEAV